MLSFKNFILEKKDLDTFTHNDNDYDLKKLEGLIKDNPIKQYKVADMTWVFEYDDPMADGPERIKTADIEQPIIVIKWYNKLVPLDGVHRLKKAEDAGIKTLPGKMVSKEQLYQCKL